MPSHDAVQPRPDGVPQLDLLEFDASNRDRREREEPRAERARSMSHSVTVDVDVPTSGAEGVIVAQGGRMGAWSLYAEEGRLKYHYSYVGVLNSEVISTSVLPSGRHQTRVEFTSEGVGMSKGGRVSLYVDGRKVGEGRIQRTHALFFSKRERVEIGRDVAGSTAGELSPRSDAFNGRIHSVQLDADELGDRRSTALERKPTPRPQ